MEWEKAARGIDGRQYTWGDEFDRNKCNTRESGIGKTTPVGRYSPDGDSPYGLADMAGNVWEWCADWYDKNERSKVWRGGSWDYDLWFARCTHRGWVNPWIGGNYLGFRCVRGSP